MTTTKLSELERYTVFHFAEDKKKRLYLLNTAVRDTEHWYFEYHRIYVDGRFNLKGTYLTDPAYISSTEVVSFDDFDSWFKENHPKRYKLEYQHK